MPRSTTTVLDPDGFPVVRHVAGPGPAADAVRHEAAVLARVHGPGVVELVDAGDLPDGGAWLATRYVPGGTLAHLARTDGEPAALAALAQVARTLDRLHRLGVVHGRCTADHVVGDLRATALCGFGEAEVAPGDVAADPGPDVAAFAALVEGVVTGAGLRAEAARRAAADLHAGPADLPATAAQLEALAASGTPSPPGEARLLHPRRGPGAGDPAAPRVRERRPVVAWALVVALVVAGAATVAAGGDGAPAPEATVATGAGPRPTAPARSAPPVPARSAPPVTAAPPAPRAVGPPVVDHDGFRWEVGAAGDLVAVGDWDCDGIDTPAVVRPVDGVVWSFPSWEAADEAVALGYVAAPVGAVAVPAGDGCDLLAVTTADGREVVVGG